MPRATWTGSIAFGLVNVPIEVFPATEDKSVRFNEFEAATGERIRHRRVAGDTGREVAMRDIVKGYEVTKGEYVKVEPDELEAVQPVRSHTIEVEDFVELDEIDPVYFRRTYYLTPKDAGRRAYWLLHAAMAEAGRVAIGRFVMRTKEYLVAIRPTNLGLLLETMYFADEVRDPADLHFGEPAEPAERELETALRLVDSLTTEWEPAAYADTYRERVLGLIESKAKGEQIVPTAEREPAPISDLMAALEASVEQAGGRRGGRGKDHDEPVRDTPGPATRTASRGRQGPPLDDLTRDELYERASEAGIEGRSKMTKDQLLKALRKNNLRKVS
jgi:DNA end-binding protein Ku